MYSKDEGIDRNTGQFSATLPRSQASADFRMQTSGPSPREPCTCVLSGVGGRGLENGARQKGHYPPLHGGPRPKGGEMYKPFP